MQDLLYRYNILYGITLVATISRIGRILSSSEDGRNLLNSAISVVLYVAHSKLIMTILIIGVSILALVDIVPKYLYYILEKMRRDMIEEYKIGIRQAKFLISCGKSVYMENSDDGMFFMAKCIDTDTVELKDLGTGNTSNFKTNVFVNSIDRIEKMGYGFYKSDSYDILLSKGFVIKDDDE